MKLAAIQENAILRTTLDFGVAVVKYCELLDALKKYVVAKQLLRSGTSIGANAMEAQDCESKADFIHKMKVAAKEACETQYWLLLCERLLIRPIFTYRKNWKKSIVSFPAFLALQREKLPFLTSYPYSCSR